jgi:type IV pilus assembly protein PilB
MSKQLAEMLVRDKVVTAAQFSEASQAVEASKGSKGYVRFFIEKKYVAETKLLYYLSQKFGLASINIAKFEISPDIIKLVPGELARKSQVIPIQVNNTAIVVALCDPTYVGALENLKFATKKNVEAVLTSYSAFDAALAKYYPSHSIGNAVESYHKDSKGVEASNESLELVQVHDIDSGSAEQDAPVIQVVNSILAEGIKLMASDIHVEPYEKRFRVRMRVDGVLNEITSIPLEMKRAVVARFKIMSRMDIAESRVPQDGRIKLKLGGMRWTFVSTPCPHSLVKSSSYVC